MNQTKNDFEGISFNSFDKSDSLFDDPNDPDSHYFGETDYSTEYFHVNELISLSHSMRMFLFCI